MKKVGRDHERLGALDLFGVIRGRQKFSEPDLKKGFLDQIEAGLTRALASASTLHGWRVQSLFESLVVSFQSVLLLKREDVGDCYYEGADVTVPDFRVVTADREQFLVEVKNCYHKDPQHPFQFHKTDFEKCQRYADLSALPLKLAVYWPLWNLWTLNRPQRFQTNGSYLEVDLPTALKENEMSLLGDVSIGTKPPLTLELVASTTEPRSVSPEGEASFTIARVELTCAGQPIQDEFERKVAFYLMLYGKWEYNGATVQTDAAGLPVRVVNTVKPSENTNQGFEMIGSLSSLFSNFYNMMTLDAEKGVSRLLACDDPTAVAPFIPRGYQGKALSLWRFVQQANFE